MAQPREKGGRVVFIGNIPYTVSEEEICHLFSSCGTVVNFRLVYDKETGKPKGFGFLEFTDTDSAASAVRNLNDHQLHGRTLRVDYSNDNGGGKGNQQGDGASRAPPPAHFDQDNAAQANGDAAALPPLPQGTELPPGLSAPDAISKTLSSLPVPQLLDMMSQVKHLATVNPDQVNALFQQAPQLGYAVFQALLLLGLVDTSILSSLVANQGQPPAAAAPPQGRPPMPTPQYGAPPVQPPYGQPPMPMPPYGSAPPQQAYAQPPPQAYAPTPPVQQPAYQPPPPPQAPLGAQMPADPNIQLQQLLALPKEIVVGLEPSMRDQVNHVRATYGQPPY
ncbi:cleavage stimulation factor subunit 2 tau variant-like [Teratosphaeria destructans]|uniref:Cleavage stimulation factor subunit 2 tau variant-like n=1 Tax=Teratosphaeria destructans TaxID=418781 RepID=A0A9W7SLF1_9PEZI|nr:cleavage stimulation factor subunit 2 tau variant-like [Teratosphaeria destructans]